MKMLTFALIATFFSLGGSHAAEGGFKKSDFSSVAVDVDRRKSTRIKGGDFDDKTEILSFNIGFRNRSTRVTFNDMKVELYLFGVSQEDRKSLKLMQRAEKTVTLVPLEEMKYDTPEVKSMWDNTGIVFGDKYKGWFLRIYSPDGELLLEKSSSSFLKNTDRLPSLKEGQYYDKNLDPTVVKSFLVR